MWRKMTKLGLLTLAMLTPPAVLLAQNPARGIKFERLSREQGLSQSTVFCILQDRQGFMWFGTEDGLNKYDGYNFTIYRHDALDSSSLLGNSVFSIYEDHTGTLWIGTDNGLNRFDRDPDSPSTRFNGKSGQFIHIVNDPKNPHSLSGNLVSSIYEDHTGTLWIGTSNGLNRFDRPDSSLKEPNGKSGQFTRFANDPNNPYSLSNNSITSIYEDSAAGNTLWIGTNGGGLNKLDREKEQFSRFVNDPNNPYSLSNNNITSIYEDFAAGNTLWIGTAGGGLNRFDREKAQFTRFVNDPNNPHSLSHNDVRSLYVDSASRNTLWIGTQGGGLNRFDRPDSPNIKPHETSGQFTRFVNDPNNPHSLSNNRIASIYEDHAGTLWIGTLAGGLNKFDREKERFIHFANDPTNPNSLSENTIWSIYEDSLPLRGTGRNTLWIGTSNGLNRFDRPDSSLKEPNGKSGQFTRFVNDPNNPHSLSHNRVSAIYEDHTGTLWIGTWRGGLNRFDREKAQFTRFVHDPKNPHSLSSNSIMFIYEDSASRTLWIGTNNGGLNKLVLKGSDRDKEQFTRFVNDPKNPHSLSDNRVLSIYEDPSTSTLWIGTMGGLNRFDRDTPTGAAEQFTHYTEKDGLPNEVIYGILADDHGRLWLSTNKGLSCFDPQRGAFKNYDVTDGLQSNQFTFYAYFKSSRSGEMFFGGLNGFNVFHPDSIKDNPYIPPVVITAFKRYNTDQAEGVAIEEKGISEKQKIKLSYKDNILSFEFAALSFRNNFKNQYAYKLEGYSDKWI